MRHRHKLKKLNRDTKHRQALFKNQLKQLVIYGSITTTLAKAKQAKRLVDKLVYRAKDGSVASRRTLHRFFGDRRIVNILVDEIAPLYSDRNSGFTTLARVGVRRGDNAPVAKLSFIKQRENVGKLNKPKSKSQKTPQKNSKKAQETKKIAKKPSSKTESKATKK